LPSNTSITPVPEQLERATLLPGAVSFAPVARRRNREPEYIAMKFTQLTKSLALGLALAAPLSAIALVGGPGIDPNSANSPWNGLGSLNIGGNFFTATLIAPGYLLTAAHVVNGAAAANVSFKVNAGTSYSIARAGYSSTRTSPDRLRAMSRGTPPGTTIWPSSSWLGSLQRTLRFTAFLLEICRVLTCTL
jgi:S1-C subfamily serine protease